MSGSNDSPAPRRSPRHRGAVRLVAAAGVGVLTTALIFVVMALLIDPTALVDRMFRIFPLIQTELAADEACEDGPLLRAVTIEGVVGHIRDGVLRPLRDVEVVGGERESEAVPVDVSADGSFRFATAFPDAAPSPCDGRQRAPVAVAQQLFFRAPGCAERRVPITRAWVPHAIVLDCEDAPEPASP
jgi:hypothetical protein